MTSARGREVDLSRLQSHEVPRTVMTLSCRDAEAIPKVPEAGMVIERDGQLLQVMHNGIVIEEGCYYGDWMTEVIKGLNGHHEPQEEKVFHAMVEAVLRSNDLHPRIVELGSFWCYYTLWFCAALPTARAIAMEPDPAYLAVGQRNAALNGFTNRIHFVHGAVGTSPGEMTEFVAESDGQPVCVKQYDLASLIEESGTNRIDIVVIDIQGYETVLLERARELLRHGAVRFALVSTHHWSISKDYLTHQRVREILLDCGGHIIAEHSVAESFSGDGLLAVSFDPSDAEMVVEVSRARPQDSLFGEPERELDAMSARMTARDAVEEQARRHITRIEAELLRCQQELAMSARPRDMAGESLQAGNRAFEGAQAGVTTADTPLTPCSELTRLESLCTALRAELDAVYATKLWRWSSAPRRWLAPLLRS